VIAPGGGCLTLPAAGRRTLMITPCLSGDKTQSFEYTPTIDGSAARLYSPLVDQCVDIDSHSLRVVQVYGCNGGLLVQC